MTHWHDIQPSSLGKKRYPKAHMPRSKFLSLSCSHWHFQKSYCPQEGFAMTDHVLSPVLLDDQRRVRCQVQGLWKSWARPSSHLVAINRLSSEEWICLSSFCFRSFDLATFLCLCLAVVDNEDRRARRRSGGSSSSWQVQMATTCFTFPSLKHLSVSLHTVHYPQQTVANSLGVFLGRTLLTPAHLATKHQLLWLLRRRRNYSCKSLKL